MSETQERIPAPATPKPLFELDAFRDKLKQLAETKKLIVTMFVAATLTLCPQLLAQPDQLEEPICEIERKMRDGLMAVTISCDDPRQSNLSLEFLLQSFPVSEYSEDEVNNPELLDASYLSSESNPNYNCHSLTLQLMQDRFGFDLGGSRASWLERGLDRFVAAYGQEVASGGVAFHGAAEFDLQKVKEGDVVLYFDASGTLIHSATVTGQDENGEWRITNKMGSSEVLESTIAGMASFYRIDGEFYDDGMVTEGGGIVRIYRMDEDMLANLPDITPVSTGPVVATA